ncbi:MAG: fibronectin type III domain-containing protein [Gammaproteobacteria bacterium]|nr:fibronectin type III domain-containing protein [Gammaproteobacteria bacterium]
MIGRLRRSWPQRLLAARGIPLLGLALGAAWAGAVVVWAAAPQADTAQADGVPEDAALHYWLSRSRWWQHIPGPPGSPVATEATANSLTVSWAAAESLAFEILGYDIAYRAAGSEAFLQRTGSGPETRTVIDGLAETTTYEIRVRARNELGPGDWSTQGSGTTTSTAGGGPSPPPSNAPPVFAEGEEARRSIPENTLAGVDIGPPVTATDPDGDVVTYGLEGNDAASFHLLSETGQIQTLDGVVYDFEAKETYSVRVTASDPHGAAASIDVTIALIDQEEEQEVPPGRPREPVVTAATLTSLTLRWEPPENSGPPITAYEVGHRVRNIGFYEMMRVPGTQTSATITGLDHSTVYQLVVDPFNDVGAGPRSPRASAATRAPHSDTPIHARGNAMEVTQGAGDGVPVTLIDRLFGPDGHGTRVSGTFLDTLSDDNPASLVQVDGGNSYRLSGLLLPGHDDFLLTGYIRHALAHGDGIVWTASDQFTRYKPGDIDWVVKDGRPFRQSAITFAAWMRHQNVLFVTSMENSTRANDTEAAFCDDFVAEGLDGKGWIPLCGEVDDYIAHSGVGLDRTVFAGGLLTRTATGAVRGDGVFAPNSIWVEARNGSTSHATAVLAAYTTELKAANPTWGAARLRTELFRVARLRDYDYHTGASGPREGRTINVILPSFAPGTGNQFPQFSTPSAYSVAENGTAVGNVAATDPDESDSVTGYAIVGGADQAQFSLTDAGALAFTSAPDFEEPVDVEGPDAEAGDNDYLVVVQASSGTDDQVLTAQHRIVVTVTDLDD